jgi:hypothetical protein
MSKTIKDEWTVQYIKDLQKSIALLELKMDEFRRRKLI